MPTSQKKFPSAILAIVLAVLCGANVVLGALMPGDVAIIGYMADNPDGLSVVALDNLAAGEVLNFTDNGAFSNGSLATTEGTFSFVVPASGIAAGEIFLPSISSIALSTGGDQVLVYQGPAASPTFIFALNNDGAGVFQANRTSSNNSALPPGIPNANVALIEVDNAAFDTSVLASGTKTEWLAEITDNSNWTGNNTTIVLPTGSITVNGASPPPPPPTPTTGGPLLITGIADGPLSGGRPKFIELYASEDIGDLSQFSINRFANGSSSPANQTLPSLSLLAGEFLYLVQDGDGLTNFETLFPGKNAQLFGLASGNGDDVFQLLEGNAPLDVYGVVGVDGSNEPWDYTDGFAFRVDGFGPNDSFTLSEWTFSGPNALDPFGNDTDGLRDALSPFVMQYQQIDANEVPEPTTIALLGFGAFVISRRRRTA